MAESSDGAVAGAGAAGAAAAPGTTPVASADRSPGSDSCDGTLSGRPGSAGMATFACGTAAAAAGAVAAVTGEAGAPTPGMESAIRGWPEPPGRRRRLPAPVRQPLDAESPGCWGLPPARLQQLPA